MILARLAVCKVESCIVRYLCTRNSPGATLYHPFFHDLCFDLYASIPSWEWTRPSTSRRCANVCRPKVDSSVWSPMTLLRNYYDWWWDAINYATFIGSIEDASHLQIQGTSAREMQHYYMYICWTNRMFPRARKPSWPGSRTINWMSVGMRLVCISERPMNEYYFWCFLMYGPCSCMGLCPFREQKRTS